MGGHGGIDGLSPEGVALALGVRLDVTGGTRDDRRDLLDSKIRAASGEGTARSGKSTMKAKIHVTLKQGNATAGSSAIAAVGILRSMRRHFGR